MTQEEKELLLKDLCCGLPHGVKVWLQGGYYVISTIDFEKQRVYLKVDFEAIRGWWFDIEEVKPYLRPMKSMTKEEEKEYFDLIDCSSYRIFPAQFCTDIINWLNAHHFDYRGLIEKGLALEAPEGMYKEN